MKLEALAALSETIGTTDSSGKLTKYGMIHFNPSSYNIDYDEISTIQIFVDEKKFDIALAKRYSEFSGNEDDMVLTYDEICDQPDFDAFCEACWHWKLF